MTETFAPVCGGSGRVFLEKVHRACWVGVSKALL